MTHFAHASAVLVAMLALPLVVHAQTPPAAPRRAGVAATRVETTTTTTTTRTVPTGGAAEAHHQLTALHRSHAMDHLRVLHDHADMHAVANTPVDRALVLEHVQAVGEHLEAAQRHQEAEERELSDAQRQANRAQLDAIHAAHADAMREHGQLVTEANRPAPQQRVLADHCAAAYHAVGRAQEAHETMGRNLGVHAAAAPAAPAAGTHSETHLQH